MTTHRFVLAATMCVALVTAGCADRPDSEGAAGASDVAAATADQDTDDAGLTPGGTSGMPAPDQVDLFTEFAKCMRGEGIDYPDPKVGENGMVTLSAGPGARPGPETDAAYAKCNPIMDRAVNGGQEPTEEEKQERINQLLEFAKCMRDHGIDYPDPVIRDGRPSGVGVGGSFDGDPKRFQAAMAACNNGPNGPQIMSTPGQVAEK